MGDSGIDSETGIIKTGLNLGGYYRSRTRIDGTDSLVSQP